MHLWNLFVAAILGLVEGLTEFAPVSSTGHMVIVDDMFLKSEKLLTPEIATVFKVVIQLGSILAVVVVFRNRFFDLLGLKRMKSEDEVHHHKLNLLQVIVGLLPAVILGLLFDDYIEAHLFSVNTVIVGLIAGAILMLIADWKAKRTPAVDTVDKLTYKHALIIGLSQCLALWPGFSRSGSTISAGVMSGLSHKAAADFTFIMAVPIMAGASALTLLKHASAITSDVIPFFIVGFVSAFIVALISIKFFLALINRIKLVPFAIYRIVLAVILFVIIHI
ncbi:undecaprenyl-diphosphate phosphatase [Falsibacillus pallidus]|uniref:Undecaprenyl-diphosphatase n=1 Tax=Falsibacillus pallidus TaxID=493781 RepID=A0A370GR50_9BACI|nr:undecaprenyl-diphosphate phosphatase [Falsibacillus pallidus]RDI45800.1 undecaprenyl-diphosphatase [Falsibacillus pallidus]